MSGHRHDGQVFVLKMIFDVGGSFRQVFFKISRLIFFRFADSCVDGVAQNLITDVHRLCRVQILQVVIISPELFFKILCEAVGVLKHKFRLQHQAVQIFALQFLLVGKGINALDKYLFQL